MLPNGSSHSVTDTENIRTNSAASLLDSKKMSLLESNRLTINSTDLDYNKKDENQPGSDEGERK